MGINGSYYSYFQSMAKVNGFKGFVGYSIRELNINEMFLYCSSNQSNINIKPIQTRVNFTSDFLIRVYLSGCYFYDLLTGKWSSDGVEILADTNLKFTHCISHHLTSFAGGLVILPSAINFQYVFANATFNQNPFIYITVVLITFLYIVFVIWAIYMDKNDLRKLRITPLKDNNPNDSYFYELMVFTGNRSESQTQSTVK